ncbi:MAG TPA: radical SAM family heme chaperone HemW [Anaerohalosphaeraceae bacterium]|nr:radical SAM family heme chaperone HemW [Anaerohalosphaeraceae bacterium]HOL88127.1 radical SAM family heme chaperone HemW [Anaerohalosphaeraceae bacterium]HPP55375.1 radical SAM family heme chaperone HemW [Anaerohalosphaeraceae bacterium]
MSEKRFQPIASPTPDNTLSVYIHVPFCARKCRYCSFYSIPYNPDAADAWSRAVLRELDLYTLQPPIQTLYIGGGSPSVLSVSQIEFLLSRLLEKTGRPTEEFTVEINPAQTDAAFFTVLKTYGVNRLSIGAQSFHPEELSFLGRLHQPEDIFHTVKTARQCGFENIGLDLIFAVPGSSLKTWKQSVRKAIALDIPHLSAYSLTYESDTPLFRDLKDEKIAPVDEDTDRQMYEAAIDILESAGLEPYEISNFARAGFACRHNLRYWDNRPWLGLGPSAASWFRGQRTRNIADLERYIESIRKNQWAFDEVQVPSALEIACETAVLNLRKSAGVNRQQFISQTGFDPMELFAEPIRHYAALGLLEYTAECVRLARPAWAVADSILCDFADV